MFARVTTSQGPPEKIDEGSEYAMAHILPAARRLEGWKGYLSLGDRQTGSVLLITLWESEEDLRASEEAAAKLRTEGAAAGEEEIVGVERFEVLAVELS